VCALSAGAWAGPGQPGCALAKEMREAPACAPSFDRVNAAWDESLRGAPCGHCGGLHDEHEMVVCDRCSTPYHPACASGTSPIGRGPWYCALCKGALAIAGRPDPVQDVQLLDYLFRGKVPDDEHAW